MRHLWIMLVVVLLMAPLISAQDGTRIVAFGGYVQEEYEYPEGSFTFLMGWTNVMYRDNSTIMVRVLGTPGNDLYDEETGDINDTFIVMVSIACQGKVLVDSHRLFSGHYTPEVLIPNEGVAEISIYLQTTTPLPQGSYCIRFMVASSEYKSEDEVNKSTAGIAIGAQSIQSISTKQYLIIGEPLPPVVEPKKEGLFWGIPVGLTIILAVVGVGIGVNIRRRRKQSVGDE